MNKIAEMIELIKSKEMNEKKQEIKYILLDKLRHIGMDKPSNFDAILDYVYDDVNETADKTDWSDGDVVIAFRRWIEEQSND